MSYLTEMEELGVERIHLDGLQEEGELSFHPCSIALTLQPSLLKKAGPTLSVSCSLHKATCLYTDNQGEIGNFLV